MDFAWILFFFGGALFCVFLRNVLRRAMMYVVFNGFMKDFVFSSRQDLYAGYNVA